eukprot:scaffold250887_cov19-Tisochrysis_lutea.AAC.1
MTGMRVPSTTRALMLLALGPQLPKPGALLPHVVTARAWRAWQPTLDATPYFPAAAESRSAEARPAAAVPAAVRGQHTRALALLHAHQVPGAERAAGTLV